MSMTSSDKKSSETARAAWLYYLEELTQGQVAKELGVSRSTVVRLLQRAKDEGLVHISLNVSHDTFATERALERRFGLETVRIVPSHPDEATQKHWLGHAAAELVVGIVEPRITVAVSWGTTLQAMADALNGEQPVDDTQIVALIGGLHNATRGTNPYEVARQLGQYFKVPSRALYAPVYVREQTTAAALADDPGVRDVLRAAREAGVVIYSMGAMHDETTMFKLGYVEAEEKAYLREHGAVGEIICRWIDRQGNPVSPPPSVNPVGLSLEEMRRIPKRLAVAGGPQKQEVVLASLRGRFVTHLVIDEDTAGFLMQAED